jgi:hypothetical protein
MTNLAFPSEDFPAQPAITLQIPEDWEPVHPPGAIMAARRAADDGTFVPNVVVRVERRPSDFETTDALVELKAFVAERPHGTVAAPFTTELDGQSFVGCELSWVDDQAGTVLQSHLFGVVASGPFLQLVQLTGSAGGADAQADYTTVKAIMNSLTVAAG